MTEFDSPYVGDDASLGPVRHCSGCSGWVSRGIRDEGYACAGLAALPDLLDQLDRQEAALRRVADLPPYMSPHDARQLLDEAKDIARAALSESTPSSEET